MIFSEENQARFVDVNIDITDIGGHGSITLHAVPVPVTFAYLAEKLADSGKSDTPL